MGWICSPGVLCTYINIAPDLQEYDLQLYYGSYLSKPFCLFPAILTKGNNFLFTSSFLPWLTKPFQSGVKGRMCTFNKSWTPLTRAAKFKMAELLPLKMHLFTSVGIPKHHIYSFILWIKKVTGFIAFSMA